MSKHASLSDWLAKWYPKILSLGALVGLVASFWQAAERVHMLKNPAAILNCNLSPVVDCSGVLGNKLSALFGFPNAFLGIVMFTVLLTSGLLLWSGGSFTKRFGQLVMAVSTILILFSFWFFGASVYSIGKICLFCIFIWASSVPIFWYGLLYYISHLPKPEQWQKKLLTFAAKNHLLVVFAAYVIMLSLFFIQFSSYYFG